MKLEGKSVFCETEREYNAVRAIAEAAGCPAWSGHTGWNEEQERFGVNMDGEFVLVFYGGCEQITFDQWIWQAEHKDTGEPVAPEWAVVLFEMEDGELRFGRFGDGKNRTCSIDGTDLNEMHPHSLEEGAQGYLTPDDIISTRPQEPKRLTIDEVIAEYPEWPKNEFGSWWIGFGYGEIGGLQPYEKGSSIDREIGHSYKICTREEYEARKAELAQADNSWHERGELPPVGSVVEGRLPEVYDGYVECEILKHHPDRPFCAVYLDEALEGCHLHWFSRFRPIQTERERLIEQALSLDCEPHEGMLSRRDFVKELIKAGWRPPKED